MAEKVSWKKKRLRSLTIPAMAEKSCDKRQDTCRRLLRLPSYSDMHHQHLQTKDTP